jgi:RNA polymerase sigma factor (sigma-70 family)
LEYENCSDEELRKACIENIRLAQHELFKRFSYMMKGVCLRYAKSEAESEDILQDAFIKIFKSLEQYSETGQLGAWMRKITLNTALEYYRKNKSLHQQVLTLWESSGSGMNPQVEDGAIEQLQLADLLLKIQALPVGFRTVFNLYAVEGYNHQEIGGLLQISEGTSKSQYSRARLMLRQMIEKESIEEQKNWKYAK